MAHCSLKYKGEPAFRFSTIENDQRLQYPILLLKAQIAEFL